MADRDRATARGRVPGVRAFSDDGQNPQRLLLPRDNPEHIDLWITDLFSGALPALAFGGETPGRGRIQSCRPCRENAARHVVHVPVKIDDLRTEYMRATLDESSVAADPLRQFERWFADAVNAQVPEPNAMTLATVGVDGDPSARIVLLKGADERGFTFFTNYASRKGRELAARPRAALLFFWPELERQIRVEGNAGQVDAAESAAYFAGRPRTSQLGAWASPQSEPIAARSVLEAQFAEFAERYRDESRPVPRPPHWGGYRLVPETIEFWQGRVSRLHDRIRYRRTQGEAPAWVVDRLAP